MNIKINEQITVYPCPYCSNDIYYSNPQNLAFHIYKEHLSHALNLIAKGCKQFAQKKYMKWCLT